MRSFRVAARDDGKIRFTVGIKRIVRKERFDQMFFVTMLPPKRSGQRWYSHVGFTSKGPMSFATFSGERGGSSTSCDIGKVVRAPKAGQERGDTAGPRSLLLPFVDPPPWQRS